ncbi:MAG: cation diffusion facilitator family transporter, partial [Candidatus Hodarchaeales archaeon]
MNRHMAKKATVIALSVNVFLGCLKIITGVIISSISLIADGFDSIMDLFIGIFAYQGTVLSQKPADDDHQFGHEKIEMLFLLLIVVFIYITGAGVLLQAMDRFINNVTLEFSIHGFLITIIAVLGKLIMSVYVYRIAVRIKSSSLKATSLNYFIDIFSSLIVLFAFISSFIGLGIFDSIAAVIICLFIFYGATMMLKEAIDGLLDRAPDEEILKRILDVSYTIEGVKEVHKLRARSTGDKITGDMHLLVDSKLTVERGHDIAEEVAAAILKEIDAKIVIHLEPYSREE